MFFSTRNVIQPEGRCRLALHQSRAFSSTLNVIQPKGRCWPATPRTSLMRWSSRQLSTLSAYNHRNYDYQQNPPACRKLGKASRTLGFMLIHSSLIIHFVRIVRSGHESAESEMKRTTLEMFFDLKPHHSPSSTIPGN